MTLFSYTLALVAGLVTAFLSSASHAQDVSSSLNVLFIAIDDLRPALGCYGDQNAITPHVDRLARRGIVFNRAYCQQAVCCPSRLSLLTGRRPDTIRVWDLATHFRAAAPDVVTLPQHFKNHGYHSHAIGKIFHGSGKPSKDPPSWSDSPLYDYVRDPQLRYATQRNLQGRGLKRASFESADVSDSRYIDGLVCNEALSTMERLRATKKPFFLAVGFRKPHLPFCAPRKYWDLYDRARIPLPASNSHPYLAPELATRSWRELEGYTDIPDDGQLTQDQARQLRHGYYACVSYIDALVGRLLEHLEKLALVDNTVVILWGDHGFHLGEQGLWAKANNYELSTRAPLIISHPGQTKRGVKTNALVELVDVYPTLVDLCQLPAPEGLEGISFMPLLEDPGRSWKQAAFSQYPRARQGHRHQGHGDIMGYAVRTERYRYVEWREWESKQVLARELYDHDSDPHEMRNVATQPMNSEIISELAKLLNAGWKSALPATTEKTQ